MNESHPDPNKCPCADWTYDNPNYECWPYEVLRESPFMKHFGHHPGCDHYQPPTYERLKALHKAGAHFFVPDDAGRSLGPKTSWRLFSALSRLCDAMLVLKQLKATLELTAVPAADRLALVEDLVRRALAR